MSRGPTKRLQNIALAAKLGVMPALPEGMNTLTTHRGFKKRWKAIEVAAMASDIATLKAYRADEFWDRRLPNGELSSSRVIINRFMDNAITALEWRAGQKRASRKAIVTDVARALNRMHLARPLVRKLLATVRAYPE